MTTPVDTLLDGLVAALREKTGHHWERYNAWDVKVTIMVKGRAWSYLHPVKLMVLDADMTPYVNTIVADFEDKLKQDNP